MYTAGLTLEWTCYIERWMVYTLKSVCLSNFYTKVTVLARSGL